MAQIGFYHGAFADSYEKQANEQGYTLGRRAEEFNKIAFAYNMLRINGYFTEKQEESICKKIQNQLMKNLKPLERKLEEETHEADSIQHRHGPRHS